MHVYLSENKWSFFEQCMQSIVEQDQNEMHNYCFHLLVGVYPKDETIWETFSLWRETKNLPNNFIFIRFQQKCSHYQIYHELLNNHIPTNTQFIFLSGDTDLWHPWRLKCLVASIQNNDVPRLKVILSLGVAQNAHASYQPHTSQEVTDRWHAEEYNGTNDSVESITHMKLCKECSEHPFLHCCGQNFFHTAYETKARAAFTEGQQRQATNSFQIALRRDIFATALQESNKFFATTTSDIVNIADFSLIFVSYANSLVQNMGPRTLHFELANWDNPLYQWHHWLYFHRLLPQLKEDTIQQQNYEKGSLL